MDTKIIDDVPNSKIIFLLGHGAGAGMNTEFMNHIANGVSQKGVKTIRFEFPYMTKSREVGKKRAPDSEKKLKAHFVNLIEEVQKDSPAFIAGMQKNDKIISINNKKVESLLEVPTLINVSTSETIKFLLIRNDKEISLIVKPKLIDGKDSLGNSAKKRVIGIKLSPPLNKEFQKQPLGPSKALYYSFKEVWFVSVTSLNYLGKMIVGSADTSQLGGPIRIAKITGQVAEYGVIPFFSIMAYISISLGLINLFPIPMLDGGHLMFYLIEKILGRPLGQKTQEGFFRIGLFLLFSLMFFVTFNDLKDLGLF